MDYLRARAIAEGKAITLPATYKILVIRVQFAVDSDPYTTGNGQFDSSKADVEAFMDKFVSYYQENSYSKLTIEYTVSSAVYTLGKTMSIYGYNGADGYDQYRSLVSDLLTTTNVEFDYTLSSFDHFMIFHAGAGEESNTGSPDTDNDIWSAYLPDLGLSSMAINEATFVPEKENGGADPFGVICHEYGHQLGLPDLYYGSDISTLAYWSLMDAGVWLGSPQGSNPSHLDAWCKLDLGFITPQEIQGDASNLLFLPAETSDSTFYKINIPVANDSTNEFFLVEYRYKDSTATYDKYIPGSGVLIYHVDNSIAQDTARRDLNNINNGSPHYAIDIEEADGTDSGDNYGDAGDAFGTGVNVFGDPLSRPYNNIESGITLMMSVSGGSGSMNTTAITYESAMSIKKLINYPNPTQDGQTTFHVRLSRPKEKIELIVYNIAGEKVYKVGDSSFSLGLTKSSDNNWVYEYTWNGKNSDGDIVASGVYFYLLRVNNDKVKTGKLAIIY